MCVHVCVSVCRLRFERRRRAMSEGEMEGGKERVRGVLYHLMNCTESSNENL